MAVLSEIGEDPCFFALLFEALEGPLEILVVVNDDFGQTGLTPFVAFARRSEFWL